MAVRIAQRREGSPHRPSRARRSGLGHQGQRAARLGEEARGKRIAAHEPRDQAFQERDQLRVELGDQVEPERFVPAESARSRVRVPRSAPESGIASAPGRQPAQTSPPAVTSRAASGHGAGRGRTPRSGRAADDGRADPPPAAPKQTETRAGRRVSSSAAGPGRAARRGRGGGRDRPSGARRISAIQAPWPSRSRSSRTSTNGCTMSKWSTWTRSLRPLSKKTSSPSVNELERAPEARPMPPGRAGHAPDLAVLAGVEVDEAVALPEGAAPDHDRLRALWSGHVRR